MKCTREPPQVRDTFERAIDATATHALLSERQTTEIIKLAHDKRLKVAQARHQGARAVEQRPRVP